MNLLQIDTKILQLINQYSINGSLVDISQNQDYLLRTRNLIDTCQKELACIRKIPDTFHITLDQIANHGKLYTEVVLPTDFKELKSIYLENERYEYVNEYRFESKKLFVKSDLIGDLVINYYKKPITITKDLIETTELEVDEDIQEIIAYCVAGWIYLEDNPTIATMLLNEYKEKRDKIRNIAPIIYSTIEDVSSDFM